jgi:hypothetical protein
MTTDQWLQDQQFGDNLRTAQIRAGGRPGRVDPRGNSYSRRSRKEKMLADPQYEHNTEHNKPNVNCVHCGTMLTYHHLEQDRVEPGGPYRYTNVQPSCRGCNLDREIGGLYWRGPSPTSGARYWDEERGVIHYESKSS